MRSAVRTTHPLRRAAGAALLALTLPCADLTAQDSGRVVERRAATELLGRFLAQAPENGWGWFHLGRVYLMAAQDWHTHGHRGDPSPELLLDFAHTALEQAARAGVDSAVAYRALVELERARLEIEGKGWEEALRTRPLAEAAAMPVYARFGLGAVAACPRRGVVVARNALESISLWYATLGGGLREDVVIIDPQLYATDPLYRKQMAAAMKADVRQPLNEALTGSQLHHRICNLPDNTVVADSIVQARSLAGLRGGAKALPASSPPLKPVDLLHTAAGIEETEVWRIEVRSLDSTVSDRELVCRALVFLFGDAPPGACRP